MLTVEEDRDMWKKLFEDCTKKQGQEIESLRQEYKKRSERLALTTAVKKGDTYKEFSSWAVPDEAPDASRTKSDNGGETPNYDRESINPGPK